MKRPRKRASSVAVIDIGSNSVRLVVYETMARSLVSDLQREDAVRPRPRGADAPACSRPTRSTKALTSLRRFRALCRISRSAASTRSRPPPAATPPTAPISSPRPSASAACKIEILSGPREAKLSALGVISGIHKPDGIVGDLGGGSLELIDVRGNRVRGGVTLPLGSLALQDLSHKSLKRAERIVKTELAEVAAAQGRPRPHLLCGRRHLARAGAHPHHPERLSAQGDARLFDSRPRTRSTSSQRLRRLAAANMLANIEASPTRGGRSSTYAALVLEYIIRVARPKTIVFSTFGVREGLLYEMLPRSRARQGRAASAPRRR